MPEPWSGARRLLAVRLDNIGDVVMLGPALRALKKALPDSSITLMASPAGSQAVPLLPWVDEAMVVRALWQDAHGQMPFDPQREERLVESIRAGNFDVAIIFTSFSQSPYPPAYACYLAGVPVRIGQSREFGGAVLSHSVPPPPDSTHQVDRNLNLLQGTGIGPAGRHLELRIPSQGEAAARALLRQAGIKEGEPFVALVPGATASARTYHWHRFALVARRLGEEIPVVVLGSQREQERGRLLAREVASPGVHDLTGQTSVVEYAAVLRRAALVVTSHSSAMHIADAFRRPLVVLFSGTDLPEQWRPRSSPAVLLGRRTRCAPCYLLDCPIGKPCLDVPVWEVVEAALGLLERDQAGSERARGVSRARRGGEV